MKINSTLTIGLLAILMSVGLLKAQNANSNQLPFNGEKEKAAWIKAHPQEYAKMTGQGTARKEVRQVPPGATLSNAERPANDPNRVENLHPQRPANDPNRVENLAKQPTTLDRKPMTETEFNALSKERKAYVLAHPEIYTVIKTVSN